MSKAEADVIAFPIKTKLVCSSCGSPGEGTCRCGVAYVSPGERAEAAVKASPDKSSRVIAKEIGVGRKTVDRVRAKTTGPSGPVETRTGEDGKKRKLPKRRSGPRQPAKADQEDKARKIVRPMVAAGQTIDYNKLGKQHGIAHVTFEKAARIETILLHETTSIDALSKSAKDKLDIAKRMIERKLNAEYTMRVRGLDEEVRQRVLAEGKEYLEMLNAKEKKARETVALYQEWTNNLKPIFTVAQLNNIMKCLDSSAISFRLKAPDPELIRRFDEAMALVRDKRDRLTLTKSK